MNHEFFVGIDVSKARLDVAIRGGSLAKPLTLQVANTPAEHHRLVDVLLQQVSSAGATLVVFESTGTLHHGAVAALSAAGFGVVVVNPRQTHHYATALGTHAKTDRIDALMLAHYAEHVRPEVRPLPSEKMLQLDALMTRRRQLVEMLAAERIRRSSCSQNVRGSIDEHITWLEQRLKDLDREIDELISSSPQWQARFIAMTSVPGVGPTTARVLIALMPELGTLTAKQVGALSGTAPIVRESGTMRGVSRTGGGRADIRAAIYLPTLSAIRFNPTLSAKYKELIARGKAKMVAVTACMRKLLVMLNAMLRDNAQWAPTAP